MWRRMTSKRRCATKTTKMLPILAVHDGQCNERPGLGEPSVYQWLESSAESV
jgi:hypothetical protein